MTQFTRLLIVVPGYISSLPRRCSPQALTFSCSLLFLSFQIGHTLQIPLGWASARAISPSRVPPSASVFSSFCLNSYLHRVSPSLTSLLFPQSLYFLSHNIYHSCLGSAPPAACNSRRADWCLFCPSVYHSVCHTRGP